MVNKISRNVAQGSLVLLSDFVPMSFDKNRNATAPADIFEFDRNVIVDRTGNRA
jgi:hypothetical protein